ncbi:MAG: phosphodiester glycosidase family protein [Eubacteriales bacterium]|nr:phosphodiester glycosidase family protein [Eubacteriales bacterium]
MKLRKTNRYFIILAFCSMLLLAYSTNAYAKSASNHLRASATVHANSKKAKKKANHNNLSYYKNTKSKATHVYNDGSKITLYQAYYNGAGGKAKYYAAHIQLKKSSYKKFGLAKANGKRSNGFQSVLGAVKSKKNKAYKAVLAVNGPFNGKDSSHWIKTGKRWNGASYHDYHEIADGKYYRGTLGSNQVTSSATYCKKTGLLAPGTSQENITNGMALSTAANKGYISDTFGGDMGFTLLSYGKIFGNKNDGSFRQRTFFGTNGQPGNFWIVVCNGQSSNGHRNDKKSKGLNMYGEGKILKNLGCTYGYNLDGGGSTTMVFKGKIVTKNWTGGGRPCYDMVYVGK